MGFQLEAFVAPRDRPRGTNDARGGRDGRQEEEEEKECKDVAEVRRHHADPSRPRLSLHFRQFWLGQGRRGGGQAIDAGAVLETDDVVLYDQDPGRPGEGQGGD